MTKTIYVEQFSESWDFPVVKETKKYYVILYTPRSGSHLLGHSLKATGKFGCPLEYFNPVNQPIWQKRFGTSDSFSTFNYIKQYRTSPNGYFGCKINYRNYQSICKQKSLNDIFPDAKYIFIRRQDLVSQAISLAKAWSSGSYISSVSGKDAVYSKKKIENACKLIIRENFCLEYIINKNNIDHIKIYYEDLLISRESVLSRIGEFLGENVESKIEGLPTDYLPKTQRNNINDEWRTRFLEEISDESLSGDLNLLQRTEDLTYQHLFYLLWLKMTQQPKRALSKRLNQLRNKIS